MSSDSLKLLSYDFEFITSRLGLIPWREGAINPGSITQIKTNAGGIQGYCEVYLHGGEKLSMTDADLLELEATIKRRAEEAKQLQREAVKENILVQHEFVQELNNRVQPGMIVGMPGKKARN